MSDVLWFLSLCAVLALSYIERRMHAEERRRLTAAALAPNPQQAAQALTAAPKPDEDHERKPRIVQAY